MYHATYNEHLFLNVRRICIIFRSNKWAPQTGAYISRHIYLVLEFFIVLPTDIVLNMLNKQRQIFH